MKEAKIYQMDVKRKMKRRFSPTATKRTGRRYLRKREVLI